ncbi:MAG: AAA-like domain-containing protein, partial [Phormidesmis sp.]
MSALPHVAATEFPCGALALESPLYVERSPVESLCYQNLQVSGSLTRIKGPHYMGKSSLLIRLLERSRKLGYRTVVVDFQAAEDSVFTDLSQFLRWFCIVVAHKLRLPPLLDEYWSDATGAKLSATIYFEEYLLEAIDQPIVLALNEVNRVFERPKIARDFLPLLRVWYEQAKQTSTVIHEEVGFQKLRTLVVHSTDVYVPLDIYKSPFNVGLPIHLEPFDSHQTQQLAERYGVTFESNQDFRDLKTLVGGHPYLLSIAFYHLKQGKLSLSQLLTEAPTPAGIYRHHLQSCLDILQDQLTLIDVMQQIVTSSAPVEVEAAVAHQLSSLGLVVLEGNACRPACELYRLFFAHHGLPASIQITDMQRLRSEN